MTFSFSGLTILEEFWGVFLGHSGIANEVSMYLHSYFECFFFWHHVWVVGIILANYGNVACWELQRNCFSFIKASKM
jgi:hypothetical protein